MARTGAPKGAVTEPRAPCRARPPRPPWESHSRGGRNSRCLWSPKERLTVPPTFPLLDGTFHGADGGTERRGDGAPGAMQSATPTAPLGVPLARRKEQSVPLEPKRAPDRATDLSPARRHFSWRGRGHRKAR